MTATITYDGDSQEVAFAGDMILVLPIDKETASQQWQKFRRMIDVYLETSTKP